MKTIALLAVSAFFAMSSAVAQADEEDCNKKYEPGSKAWQRCMQDTGGGELENRPGDRVSKGSGRCGSYSYYSTKKHKCMDARLKK